MDERVQWCLGEVFDGHGNHMCWRITEHEPGRIGIGVIRRVVAGDIERREDAVRILEALDRVEEGDDVSFG